MRKQRRNCEFQFPQHYSTISAPKNRGLGTGLGNLNYVTGKLILNYATRKEATYSNGPKRGKLKKGFRYVGDGFIVRTLK